MASTESTMSGTVRDEVRVIRTKRYRWPAAQLNFWLLIMIVGSSLMLGVFSSFITVQNQLGVGTPWFVSRISLLPSSVPSSLRYFISQRRGRGGGLPVEEVC
jgi:hypothetical protein